jgi:hypothetical protein
MLELSATAAGKIVISSIGAKLLRVLGKAAHSKKVLVLATAEVVDPVLAVSNIYMCNESSKN